MRAAQNQRNDESSSRHWECVEDGLVTGDKLERVTECKVTLVNNDEPETTCQTTSGESGKATKAKEGEVFSDIPSVTATPLHEALVCMPFLSDDAPLLLDDSTQQQTLPKHGSDGRVVATKGRPEFIYASTLVSDDCENVLEYSGISFESRPQGHLAVSTMTDESPFQDTNIHVGDILVAINGYSCSRSSLERVQELMQASHSKLSLCVHYPQGDPKLVSSSIVKPLPNSRVGITLSRFNDTMRVGKMTPGSLFHNSLLVEHQRCLAINGIPCECLTAGKASNIITSSNTMRVTIISKIQRTRPVTLASVVDEEPVGWWRKVAHKAGSLRRNTGNYPRAQVVTP